MKINGNEHGAHEAKKPAKKPAPQAGKTPANTAGAAGNKPPRRRRMGRAAKMATMIVCCVLALICAVAAWYMLWEEPPERPSSGLNTMAPTEAPESPDASATPVHTDDPNAGAPASLNENM